MPIFCTAPPSFLKNISTSSSNKSFTIKRNGKEVEIPVNSGSSELEKYRDKNGSTTKKSRLAPRFR